MSGQLNGEAFAMAFRNIYTFGPTFRGELQHHPPRRRVLDDQSLKCAAGPVLDDKASAEDMIKYIIAFVRKRPRRK